MRNRFHLAKIWVFCIGVLTLLVNCGNPEDHRTSGEELSPQVSWKSPVDGQSITTTDTDFSCEALGTFAEPGGTVSFYLDGSLINLEKQAPYTCALKISDLTAGDHKLEAVAIDKNGKKATAHILVKVIASTESDETKAPGRHFFVNAETGNDTRHDGLSKEYAWRSISKLNATNLQPGDTVTIVGTVVDQVIKDPGKGTKQAPITIIGEGSYAGRARIRGIYLDASEYVTFRNLDIQGLGVKGNKSDILIRTQFNGKGAVRFITFDNLSLHDAYSGVDIGGPKHTDITFKSSSIKNMFMDGIVLEDAAGDRFSFLGGSISYTGQRPGKNEADYDKNFGWGTHGIYSSGGRDHLFDGVTFSNNKNGWSISLRRGNFTVRNCTFWSGGSNQMINNNNEDEGSSNPYTGSPSRKGTYSIYRNRFIGPGVALYQGSNNDRGVDDPQNTWAIFNNTFVNTTINFAGKRVPPLQGHGKLSDGTMADTYHVYLRNNVFWGAKTKLQMASPRKDYVHAASHNNWWQATVSPASYQNKATDLFVDPGFDTSSKSYKVLSGRLIDKGSQTITPDFTLPENKGNRAPWGYVGQAPDIGADEY